jgi:hypothetical protein
VINRSTTRDTPSNPMASHQVACLFGTRVAETILASVHVRAHRQAGHMGASDLIKALHKNLARRGPSTYGFGIISMDQTDVTGITVFGYRLANDNCSGAQSCTARRAIKPRF